MEINGGVMVSERKETIAIFSNRIAKSLIHNNFQVVDIDANLKCKFKTVFYFMNNNEIRKFLKERHNIVLS